MMGVLFCCGAGFFIRRRMYPSPLRDETAFNVSFTRHPVNSPGPAGSGSEPSVRVRLFFWRFEKKRPGCTNCVLSSGPSVSQQPGSMQGFGVNGMAGADPVLNMAHPVYPPQPGSAHKMMSHYPPPPSYCNHPPPPYEQVFQNSDKK